MMFSEIVSGLSVAKPVVSLTEASSPNVAGFAIYHGLEFTQC